MTEPFVPPDTESVRAYIETQGYLAQADVADLLDAIDVLILQRDLLAGAMRVNAIQIWKDEDRMLAGQSEVFVMDVMYFPHTAIKAPPKGTPAYDQMVDGQSALHQREADFEVMRWLEEIRPAIREKLLTHRMNSPEPRSPERTIPGAPFGPAGDSE